MLTKKMNGVLCTMNGAVSKMGCNIIRDMSMAKSCFSKVTEETPTM